MLAAGLMADGIAVEKREVPPPSEPLAVARQFLDERMTDDASCLLLSHRGTFYAWAETCWPELEEAALRSDLYRWLEHAVYERETRDGIELVPWAPTRSKIGNVVDALHAATHLAAGVEAPAWLDDRDADQPGEIVSLANGLLNLRTRELLPHTPAFFTQHSLSFAYDPDAAPPKRWHRFLDELWADDGESIQTLAEEMGYVLGGGTEQQKMFLAVGPKRSGKGTIGRVLTGLLGAHNVAAPTLSSLTSNFGISPLIGKPLAIISDARLSSRADNMIAVERLLSISGEDSITVDRKFLPAWTGRLPTRFLILTNELPRFADSSGALASRFVLIVLTRSFYDHEDPTLTAHLLEEAPGIFNWALDGLDRLHARGYFLQPESAREALQHFEDLGSPVGAFVRDVCVTGAAHEIPTDDLFQEWKTWCADEGRPNPGTKAVFVKDVRAAVPLVRPSRPRDDGTRRRVLRGIAVRAQQSDGPRTSPAHDPSQIAGPGWSEDHSTAEPNGEPTLEQDDLELLQALIQDTNSDAQRRRENSRPDEDHDADLDFDALRRLT
jgi:putative DNA primase/helicase